MRILLWLDDRRDPKNPAFMGKWAIDAPNQVVWVKDYEEFVQWITDNGLPDGLNFDHDIADSHYGVHLENWRKYTSAELGVDPTGMDAANWLIEYCLDNDLDLPPFRVHSDNPVGVENIATKLRNYVRFRQGKI